MPWCGPKGRKNKARDRKLQCSSEVGAGFLQDENRKEVAVQGRATPERFLTQQGQDGEESCAELAETPYHTSSTQGCELQRVLQLPHDLSRLCTLWLKRPSPFTVLSDPSIHFPGVPSQNILEVPFDLGFVFKISDDPVSIPLEDEIGRDGNGLLSPQCLPSILESRRVDLHQCTQAGVLTHACSLP